MGDDDNIVTTFYVEGEVSLYWDRQTGELASLYMNSTLFPNDLADMRMPLNSSAIASSPSMNDNCSMFPLISESVADVNPLSTSSTTVRRPSKQKLDCPKASSTSAVEHPDVISYDTKLRSHTHYTDCAESSCTNAGAQCVVLSNNTQRLPTYDCNSGESSCTDVGVHSLVTSLTAECKTSPHKSNYQKLSSTRVDVIRHVSSTTIHRPPTHHQDCTKSSCEPNYVEDKGICASPERSPMQTNSVSILCNPQDAEREVIDSSNRQDLITRQGTNKKHIDRKPLVANSYSMDNNSYECKDPISFSEGVNKDVKTVDANTSALPPSTDKNPSTEFILASTEKKASSVPSNAPCLDIKTTASALSLCGKKGPSLPSESLMTMNANVGKEGPYIYKEPSGASLSSSTVKDSLISSPVLPSMESLSVVDEKMVSSHPSSSEKKSNNAIISESECASASAQNVVTSCEVTEEKSSEMPKESNISKPLFSFGLESTSASLMPSIDSTAVEKKSSFLRPEICLLDAKTTTLSAHSEKEPDSSLSNRVSALPGKKSRKRSREVDPSLKTSIDTKRVLSPWFSSTKAQSNAPEAPCNPLPLFTFTSLENSDPCSVNSKNMLAPCSSVEKTSDAATGKIRRGSIKRTEKNNPPLVDKNNSCCFLRSSCKDGNCEADSYKDKNCEANSYKDKNCPSSSCNVTPSTSMPSLLEKMNSKTLNVSPLEVEATKPLPTDKKWDSASAGQASKQTSKEGMVDSSIRESPLPLGGNSGPLPGNSTDVQCNSSIGKHTLSFSSLHCKDEECTSPSSIIKRLCPTSIFSSVTNHVNAHCVSSLETMTPGFEVPSQSSTCNENGKGSSSRRITRQQKGKGGERARESDLPSAVSNFSEIPTDANLIVLSPFTSEDLKGSVSDSLIDKKPASCDTNLKSSSLSSSHNMKSSPLDVVSDEKPASLNAIHLFDFVSKRLASSAKEIKMDPSPTIGVTRQQSIKMGKKPREVRCVQSGDQTNYIGPSLGDAKSLPPTFSVKKTSPVSPEPSTGHSNRKANKRSRKGDLCNTDKVEAMSPFNASGVEEKPVPLLHESATQHRRIKARKRPREVDVSSKDNNLSLLQQLVLANPNHIPQYLDGPSSSSSCKDRSILNSRDVRDGRNKRHKSLQLSFRPMECGRPRNAFIFFSMRERQKFAVANPHFSFGEVSKLVAWSWHNMSDADKKPYRMLALEDASRYHNKVSESYRTWEHLADRGLQILYVVDIVCEWLSQKLPRWAQFLSRSSLGSKSP